LEVLGDVQDVVLDVATAGVDLDGLAQWGAGQAELSREAADTARGRRQSEQRRRKTLQALAAISPEAHAAGSRRSADEQRRRTSAEAAARLGHPDIGSLVRDRVAAGASLSAISREAGLHKDWLCRHLAKVDPVTAREVAEAVTGPGPSAGTRGGSRSSARWGSTMSPATWPTDT
jgi:hypothetical protein